MHNQLYDIEKLITSTSYWSVADNSHLFAHSGLSEPAPPRKVSDAFLAEQHPLLPVALRALIEWHAKSRTLSAAPHWHEVYSTLSVLVNGLIELTSVDGDMVKLSAIRTIHVDWNLRQVELFGITNNMPTITHNSALVPFCVDHSFRYVDVSIAELESTYPGWEDRYKLAHDIGADMQTMVRTLFYSQPPVSQPLMPDLTFD